MKSNKLWPLFLLLIITGIESRLAAQDSARLSEGMVSYITGQNIYVKFDNTGGIENGDTLFIYKEEFLVPVLVVQQHSSISCLCIPIGGFSLKISDKVIAKSRAVKSKTLPDTEPEAKIEQDVNEQVLTQGKESLESKFNGGITGRLSVTSYSGFSNTGGDDFHRFRYTLSMDAANISDSRLSLENYISFTHKLNQWNVVQENLNNALKIYNLALKYEFNNSMSVWLGRKINPKIANIGAVDGLQFQKKWNNIYLGVLAGSRPDFKDYGFNPELFEYGLYIGQYNKVGNGFFQTSLAFFELRNHSNIDRRFIYFQHSNSWIRNMTVFSSLEMDLYKLENEKPKNSISLTSLYLSVRYRINQKLTLFSSYDNRKNVIYFETFRNYADEVLQQASRQGFRFRANYRPVNYLHLGFNAGTRFRKEDPRPTRTVNGYTTYTRLPIIKASLTTSVNLLQTSYLNGKIYGSRLSKDIMNGKFYTMMSYRRVNFDYVNSISKLVQHIGELNFAYRFNKKLYLSVNFETTFQDNENYNRLYLGLKKRF